ncbi:hypothetical protein HispidOSU_005912 [Sigmodon hispidus]
MGDSHIVQAAVHLLVQALGCLSLLFAGSSFGVCSPRLTRYLCLIVGGCAGVQSLRGSCGVLFSRTAIMIKCSELGVVREMYPVDDLFNCEVGCSPDIILAEFSFLGSFPLALLLRM